MSTRTCMLPVVLVAVLLTLPCTLEGKSSSSDSGASVTEHILRWQASPPSPSSPVQETHGFGCALTDEAMEQLYRWGTCMWCLYSAQPISPGATTAAAEAGNSQLAH